jgi:hypothetical protein
MALVAAAVADELKGSDSYWEGKRMGMTCCMCAGVDCQ